MILQSLLTFVLAATAGFGLAHLLWPDPRGWAVLLKFFLGIGLGLGISSCLYFLRLVLFPGQGGYLLIQIVFFALVVIGTILRGKSSPRARLRFKSISAWQLFLGLAALLVLGFTLYYLLMTYRISPHGDYDAQAIWNLRARSMLRLGENWENAFSPDINRNFHMDYPLLIPLNVVGGWNTLGSEVLRVPAVQSMLFLLGLAGLAFSALAYLRSSSQAAIGMIVLLATPFIVQFSTFQTADIPLAYFFLASAILFVLALQQNSRGLLFLCGLAAGLSAWTKNEGLTFVLIISVSMLIALVPGKEWSGISSFLGGLALPLLTILLFKILLPARNDLLADNAVVQILQKIADPVRYGAIFIHLKTETAGLGGWPVNILILLALYGLVMGKNRSFRYGRPLWLLVFIVAAQFLAYFLIYLITPNDLEWQLNYSMSRLLIHLFPTALLLFFLFIRTPDQIFASSPQESPL